MRDDESIDGVLHSRSVPGELSGHRVRVPNPQIEADRFDRMLRECSALNFLDSHIEGRRE
jgi:hypothetical protein